MQRTGSGFVLAVLLASVLAGGAASAAQFEITVTNVTRGQQFTPLLVATHRQGVQLFNLGDPASPELATLAEEGDTAPLQAMLEANPDVLDVETFGPLLDPGASRTVFLETKGTFNHVSLAAMLIPTNDGFFSLNGVQGPRNGTLTLFSTAYDSGSEINDETCANIPGPFFVECGGPGGGGMPVGGEENYVHIHAGMHGIEDMDESQRDWRNPVARIVIRRVR